MIEFTFKNGDEIYFPELSRSQSKNRFLNFQMKNSSFLTSVFQDYWNALNEGSEEIGRV